VSTGSSSFLSDGSDNDIGERKARHLELCVSSEYSVESGSALFDQLSFVHHALPEVSADDLDTTVSFLNHTIQLPFLISSMTGGSAEGYKANKDLARAAQECGIPVGMGSIRILFRKPEVFDHFYLKALAPDVPVIANLGGVQLRDMDQEEIAEMLRRLEVQALAVHLNAGQELFQPGGDRDFRGIFDAIRSFVDRSPVPLIVKETGFGIRPQDARKLLDAGVQYVNVAGAGGTNWIQVEAYRLPEHAARAANAFSGWGTPTALLLAALGHQEGRLIASGGMRDGMDVAKALALGAHVGAMALPFIRAVTERGVQGALETVGETRAVLETAMVLTGSRTVAELRRTPLMRSYAFDHALSSLCQAEEL
jgi:isopentenyl-diphosphate delta-isomerase type 2